MRALGIDFGTKVIGLAITNNNKTIVTPLQQFTYHKNNLLSCIHHLKKICSKYSDVDTFVIGYPIYKSGDKSPICLIIDNFKLLLHKYFPNIIIHLHNEIYTTLMATEILKDIGLKASQIKKAKDKMSAVIILESWLKNARI